jgi:hypothetical protein
VPKSAHVGPPETVEKAEIPVASVIDFYQPLYIHESLLALLLVSIACVPIFKKSAVAPPGKTDTPK